MIIIAITILFPLPAEVSHNKDSHSPWKLLSEFGNNNTYARNIVF